MGGGIGINFNARPIIESCVIVSNSCDKRGGGIYGANNGDSVLLNCTIIHNSSTEGGGVYNFNTSISEMKNCIIWTNMPNQIVVTNGTPDVGYSCVQGGAPGTSNITINPLFTSVYLLATNSPCIDQGDPATVVDPTALDINGDPRLVGSAIDMGAAEVQ